MKDRGRKDKIRALMAAAGLSYSRAAHIIDAQHDAGHDAGRDACAGAPIDRVLAVLAAGEELASIPYSDLQRASAVLQDARTDRDRDLRARVREELGFRGGAPRRLEGTGAEQLAPYYADYDVNPICGHHLGRRCDGCGTCTRCDGCYCAEDRDAYRDEMEAERASRAHVEHERYVPDCPLCWDEGVKTDGFTSCPTCGSEMTEGYAETARHDLHGGRCRTRPQPAGIDWSYLLGQAVTLTGSSYAIHGRIDPHQTPPEITDLQPRLILHRTDPGYDEVVPIYLREWHQVDPAPPAPGILHAPLDDVWQVSIDPRYWCDLNCRKHEHTYRARCRCGARFTAGTSVAAAFLLRAHLAASRGQEVRATD